MTEKQLKDEELKQVSGGAEAPYGRKPKYVVGNVVVYDNGWVLEIVDLVYWGGDDSGFLYKAKILEIEKPSGHYYVGAVISIVENRIVEKRYGI